MDKKLFASILIHCSVTCHGIVCVEIETPCLQFMGLNYGTKIVP